MAPATSTSTTITNSRILEQTLNGNTVVLVTASQPGTAHSSIAINGAGTSSLSPRPSQGKVVVIEASASPVTVQHTRHQRRKQRGQRHPRTSPSQACRRRRRWQPSISPTPRPTRSSRHRSAYDGSASHSPTCRSPGLSTPLSSPYGLAVDNNFLYIADSGNGRILEVNINTGAAVASHRHQHALTNQLRHQRSTPPATIIVANAGANRTSSRSRLHRNHLQPSPRD